jgi:hypothetical protein
MSGQVSLSEKQGLCTVFFFEKHPPFTAVLQVYLPGGKNATRCARFFLKNVFRTEKTHPPSHFPATFASNWCPTQHFTSMAKEFLQTLEDYTRDYFSKAASVAASMGAHSEGSNFKPAQAEPIYERLYETSGKIKSKVEVQRVFITKYAPLENKLAIGPNSVFNFGQYLTRTSKS